MDEHRRRQLARRYRELARKYDQRLDIFDCGRRMAEQVDRDLYRWGVEIAAIESEVREALALDG